MKNNNRSIHLAAPLVLALPLLFGALPAAQAQVSVGVGISLPGVNIGINLPLYPQLVRVPGYPVYYAPSASTNYFFYDGLYWVYADDNWYSSDWYNGPWYLVEPAYVPVFVLRVPVRYYRRPPVYFRSWRADAPPRWGDHWGRDWENRHRGWDRWDRRAVPAPAPLPVYQRNYTGDRYPRAPEQQRDLRAQNYRYQPREAVSKQQFQRPVAPSSAVAPPPRDARPDRADRRPDRPVPPPPRDAQRPQPTEGSQARPQVQPPRPQVQPPRPQVERPNGPPERPQGRPERTREQPAQAQPRPQAERVQPPPQRSPEQRGPQGGGPGREAQPGQRGGEAQQDRGRGGPPEGRGRDKDK
ncbi:hypothetical protein [Rhizobacter sp. Root404]|uniref:hypothetical protein n=1 Tax=Rhizobacter sp. Root404 TaxID=1736528 RepID=UPI0006F2E202|nr:hypothetical protein [Rhizobacter sp. Root404]KQW36012.1 hypothetical protein ASC76_14850 [Rhizobacter sp. Root404]